MNNSQFYVFMHSEEEMILNQTPKPNSWVTQLNILKLICVCVCVQFLVTTTASKTVLQNSSDSSNSIIPFLPFLKSKGLNIHNWRTSMIIFLLNNNIYFWISYLADQLRFTANWQVESGFLPKQLWWTPWTLF